MKRHVSLLNVSLNNHIFYAIILFLCNFIVYFSHRAQDNASLR